MRNSILALAAAAFFFGIVTAQAQAQTPVTPTIITPFGEVSWVGPLPTLAPATLAPNKK